MTSKWEAIISFLQDQPGTQELVAQAQKINDLLDELYIFDIPVAQPTTTAELERLVYDNDHCVACYEDYLTAQAHNEEASCKYCHFAKKAGYCSEPQSLFHQFTRTLMKYLTRNFHPLQIRRVTDLATNEVVCYQVFCRLCQMVVGQTTLDDLKRVAEEHLEQHQLPNLRLFNFHPIAQLIDHESTKSSP